MPYLSRQIPGLLTNCALGAGSQKVELVETRVRLRGELSVDAVEVEASNGERLIPTSSVFV